MNMENIDNITIDNRGNRWIKTSIDKDEQKIVNEIVNEWATTSDENIDKVKKIILNNFGENHQIRGMPSNDFIYMCTSDNCNHYFLQTGNKDPIIYKYEGECDIIFTDSTTLDDILITI
jgi:hypothetical protein